MAGPGREPTVSDNEIIQVFEQCSDPVLTTREVADQLEIGHRGAFDRLKKLTDSGEIQMKKVGKSGAVWWHPPTLTSESTTVR